MREVRAIALALVLTAGFQIADSLYAIDAGGEVRRVVEEGIAWSGLTGVAVAVVRDGVVVHQSTCGDASVELGVPITSSTLFQLSSTTKIFTATAAMILVERGQLELEAFVGTYLPGLPEGWKAIRLRDLLAHLSGLPEVVKCESPDFESALACVTARPLVDETGAHFRYNQTNYMLVQRILEQLSGLPLPELLQELLFRPAGMLATVHAGDSHAVVPGRATSYYPDGSGGLRIREVDFPPYLLSAAGLNSSLEDLVRWEQALTSGRLLRPESLERMWRQPTLGDGRVSNYALGWSVKRHAGGRVSVGHEGGGLTTLRRFVDDRLTVILLTNGSRYRFDPDELAESVAAVFVPDLRAEESRLLFRMRSAAAGAGDGVETAVAAYRSFLAQPETSTADTEGTINRFGYDLLARDRPADAVRIFRLNTERYPDSSNAFDSLGEGLAAAGEKAEAIRSYRESLRLDPANSNAGEMLERLEAEPTRGEAPGAA